MTHSKRTEASATAIPHAMDLRAGALAPAIAGDEHCAPTAGHSARFSDRLAAALEHPLIVHVAGDGVSFRQAVAAPVAAKQCEGQTITARHGNLPNVLIERCNGQILCVRLLDDTPQRIHLDQMMQLMATALPECIENAADYHQAETLIEKISGCQVTIEDCVLDTCARGFFASAIAELTSSLFAGAAAGSIPDSILEEPPTYSRAAEILRAQLGNALETFVRRLDARIVSALARSGSPVTVARYNRYRHLGNAARHRRLQAAEAFPLIGAILIDKDRQHAHLRRAIDRRLPLTPAIGKILQVPPEVIRWLMGKDIERVGTSWTERAGELAQLLSHICPEHRPATPEDWSAFGDFAAAVMEMDARNQGSPFLERVTATDAILRQIGGMGWHRAKVRFETMGIAITDVADMTDMIDEIVQVLAEHIGEGGVLGELLHDELVPHVKKLYFSVGIMRQLKASLRWHRLMLDPGEPVDAQVCAASPSMHSWPAPFDGVLDIDGLAAVSLTNPQQLKDEGMHMQHCVRNYAAHCLYYGSTIVSLRRHDGLRLSTAELNLAGGSSGALRFEVRQHRGPKNATPHADAVAAFVKLLTLLNGPGAASRRQLMHSALKQRQAVHRDRTSIASDPRRMEKLKRALVLHVGYEHFYEEGLRVARGRL